MCGWALVGIALKQILHQRQNGERQQDEVDEETALLVAEQDGAREHERCQPSLALRSPPPSQRRDDPELDKEEDAVLAEEASIVHEPRRKRVEGEGDRSADAPQPRPHRDNPTKGADAQDGRSKAHGRVTGAEQPKQETLPPQVKRTVEDGLVAIVELAHQMVFGVIEE